MVIGNTYQYFKIINSPSVQYCRSVVKSLLLVLQIAGKLHIQISKLGGSFLERYGDTTNEDIEDTDPAVSRGTPMIVRVRLESHCQQGYLLVLIKLNNFTK